MRAAFVACWALALILIFWRYRFRRQWWQLDVVAALTFVVLGVSLGTPVVGIAESLKTGMLFAIYAETCIVLAFGVRGWVRGWFERS